MKTPANILWPAAIIGLLFLSGVTTFGVLFASRSDGGARVVEGYYRKSVSWDSLAAVRRASSRLGWNIRIRVNAEESFATAALKDSSGSTLSGLAGSVTVSRPQSTTTYGTHGLTEDEKSPGMYHFSFPYKDTGLWDLDIVVSHGDDQFVDRVRIEI